MAAGTAVRCARTAGNELLKLLLSLQVVFTCFVTLAFWTFWNVVIIALFLSPRVPCCVQVLLPCPHLLAVQRAVLSV